MEAFFLKVLGRLTALWLAYSKGKSDHANAGLKTTLEIKRKQAIAAKNAPHNRRGLVKWLRYTDD